jgi:hypothetical protein
MSSVTLTGVRKLFGALEVIKGIDLTVADRELVVFVGPSGCGKSTLLRMIAGLEDVDYGAVQIGGVDVTERAPAARGVAMVFQNYALYPQHDGLRQSGLWVAQGRCGAGRGGPPRARGGQPVADQRTSGTVAEIDVGRTAAARGHRPGHRAQPRGFPVRRTAVEP